MEGAVRSGRPPSPDSPLCRHCGKEVVTRPRGLGWKCFYTPGVKELYPLGDGYYGVSDYMGSRPLPPEPTDIEPGEAKIAIFQQRASGGYNLWHPLDKRREE